MNIVTIDTPINLRMVRRASVAQELQPTDQLAGAQLAYWTARADRIDAEKLHLQLVPRTDLVICVLTQGGIKTTYDPIGNPHITQRIVADQKIATAFLSGEWHAFCPDGGTYSPDEGFLDVFDHHADGAGPDIATAAMRAFVRSRFGETVCVVPLEGEG